MTKPPGPKTTGNYTTIPPGAYPVMPAATAFAVAKQLRNPTVQAAAARALDEGAGSLRVAVAVHVDRLQDHLARLQAAAAAGDFDRIYAEAHEVRGLAGNAGLTAAARIAGELCRYLDAMLRAGAAPEITVVRVHLEAGLIAARAEDEATRLGGAVADSLAALVGKKLAEINDPETVRLAPR